MIRLKASGIYGRNMCLDLGKNRGINQAGQEDNKKRLIRLSKKLTERQKAKREKTASKETDTPSYDGAERL